MSYFRLSAPAFAIWASCCEVTPETPMLPMSLPSTTIGTPPSSGLAPLSFNSRRFEPPCSMASWNAIEQGGSNLRLLKLSGASPLEGGVPIVVDGKLIGSIGVSGVTSQQDAQIARAGADSLK